MSKRHKERIIFAVEGESLSFYEEDGQFFFVRTESAVYDLLEEDRNDITANETMIFESLEELKAYVMEKYPHVDEDEFL